MGECTLHDTCSPPFILRFAALRCASLRCATLRFAALPCAALREPYLTTYPHEHTLSPPLQYAYRLNPTNPRYSTSTLGSARLARASLLVRNLRCRYLPGAGIPMSMMITECPSIAKYATGSLAAPVRFMFLKSSSVKLSYFFVYRASVRASSSSWTQIRPVASGYGDPLGIRTTSFSRINPSVL